LKALATQVDFISLPRALVCLRWLLATSENCGKVRAVGSGGEAASGVWGRRNEGGGAVEGSPATARRAATTKRATGITVAKSGMGVKANCVDTWRRPAQKQSPAALATRPPPPSRTRVRRRRTRSRRQYRGAALGESLGPGQIAPPRRRRRHDAPRPTCLVAELGAAIPPRLLHPRSTQVRGEVTLALRRMSWLRLRSQRGRVQGRGAMERSSETRASSRAPVVCRRPARVQEGAAGLKGAADSRRQVVWRGGRCWAPFTRAGCCCKVTCGRSRPWTARASQAGEEACQHSINQSIITVYSPHKDSNFCDIAD
jgi:hypothetical protein